MSCVLFVDDEPRVLDGLRRSLRGRRHTWDMHFAVGGAEALKCMEKQAFDVLVSDMRMPGMDGIALLKEVKAFHPECTRIILSGHSDFDNTVLAVPLAHQFLAKPCEGAVIEAAVERATSVKLVAAEPPLNHAIGSLESLPVRRTVLDAMRAAVRDPEVDIEVLAKVAGRDPGFVVRLFQLVNSSFFGLARQIESIEDAIRHLGVNALTRIVQTEGAFRVRDDWPEYDRMASLTGRVAESICGDNHLAKAAFSAGLLADIGLLVLREPEYSPEFIDANHAEVGHYLANLFGIPTLLSETIGAHQTPSKFAVAEFVTAAVHIATNVVKAQDAPHVMPGLDKEYLAGFGLNYTPEQWSEFAVKLLAPTRDAS